MKAFLKWAAGILEDKKGSASSKRIGFFWAFALVTYMIVKMIGGAKVNMEMYWSMVGIIGVAYGLITSEFFKKPNP